MSAPVWRVLAINVCSCVKSAQHKCLLLCGECSAQMSAPVWRVLDTNVCIFVESAQHQCLLQISQLNSKARLSKKNFLHTAEDERVVKQMSLQGTESQTTRV
ncbi:hypothetical protein BsWGS_10732 [Bradybaena similaris]